MYRVSVVGTKDYNGTVVDIDQRSIRPKKDAAIRYADAIASSRSMRMSVVVKNIMTDEIEYYTESIYHGED